VQPEFHESGSSRSFFAGAARYFGGNYARGIDRNQGRQQGGNGKVSAQESDSAVAAADLAYSGSCIRFFTSTEAPRIEDSFAVGSKALPGLKARACTHFADSGPTKGLACCYG
jgi:hypothetical protein